MRSAVTHIHASVLVANESILIFSANKSVLKVFQAPPSEVYIINLFDTFFNGHLDFFVDYYNAC